MYKKYFLSVAILFGMLVSNAQTTPSVEVTGVAVVKDLPEIIEFSVPIEFIESEYQVVNNGVIDQVNAIQQLLQKAGLPEKNIRTDNFRISKHYEYVQGKKEFKGYKGNVQLRVWFDFNPTMVQKVVSIVSDQEVQYGVNFRLSEQQKNKLNKMAIKNAVTDAREKAELLAEASGSELGELQKIEYGTIQVRPTPLQPELMHAKMDAVGSNELQLSPSMISTHRSVFMVWSMN